MESAHEGVSVVIPSYNRASLIGRALRSVLAAGSPGDEVIVIDDGSTDGTAEVVRGFDGVRYLRTENQGLGAARNYGIRMSNRPLVAFLDSDDEWLPHKLQLQRAVMSRYPQAVYSFCNLYSQRLDGTRLHDLVSDWRTTPWVGSESAPLHLKGLLGPGRPYSSIAKLPPGQADFDVYVGHLYAGLMQVHYVTSGGIVVRRSIAGDQFHFPTDRKVMEDWDCYARLAKLAPVAYLDTELAVMHVHGGPRMTDAREVEQIDVRLAILQRIWGADADFVAGHLSSYEALLRSMRTHRARYLVRDGRLQEVRDQFFEFGGPPWLRLLASLPAWTVRPLLSIRRLARKVVS